jgi:hypothetical protein
MADAIRTIRRIEAASHPDAPAALLRSAVDDAKFSGPRR